MTTIGPHAALTSHRSTAGRAAVGDPPDDDRIEIGLGRLGEWLEGIGLPHVEPLRIEVPHLRLPLLAGPLELGGVVPGERPVGVVDAARGGALLAAMAGAGAWRTPSATGGGPVDTSRSPVLGSVTRRDFERVAGDMRSGILWVNDGYCLMRGTLGAGWGNAVTSAAQPAGVRDALTAALVVTPPGILSVDGSDWWFHAATVMQVQGEAKPRVIDYLLFDEPVPLDVWASRIGIDEDDLRIVSPYVANIGTRDDGVVGLLDEAQPLDRAAWAAYAGMLLDTWRAAVAVRRAENVMYREWSPETAPVPAPAPGERRPRPLDAQTDRGFT